jgi:exosortase E/protease (VPEID-CTERM system)
LASFISTRLFEIPDGRFVPTVGWVTLWGIAAVATFALWLLALAPVGFWRWLVRTERLAFSVAGLAAIAAWSGGLLAQKLWRPLAESTFWITRILLETIDASIISDPESGILGTSVFLVQIAPQCSGYEGMSLVTVFVAVYLWLFRDHLRFPHALLLFPLGILAIYVANVIRLAALILLGAHFSPKVAAGGFHSQAGWIAFTVIAVGVVALGRHTSFFSGTTDQTEITSRARLATALLTPFLALTAVRVIGEALSTDFDVLYPTQVIVTAAVLWHFRSAYRTLGWNWSWQAVWIGIVVFFLVITLEPASTDSDSYLAGLANMPYWAVGIWIVVRIIGSVVIVPLAEELAFRGYLIRKIIARDFEKVPLNKFTWVSFTVSSVMFGLLHDLWVSGIISGMLFALALYRRGQVGDAVVAHATANAFIATHVLVGAKWTF